ncbi:MAG: hypothetical protein HON99_09315 [Crocinitomicaceae bacterium]|nr:hypothetical protein [Crocinitomicaceae bacterium]
MMRKWSPIYFVARLIVTFGSIGFYKKFESNGQLNIPKNKPIIYAPNHQSGFMDPILIASLRKKQTHFLVRADVFRSKFIITVFKWLKMMPVYRQRDGKSGLEKNQAIFNQCYRILKKGNGLIIFPEGNQLNKKSLRSLKKGIGRIALGAETKYNFDLDVNIIPVGINYGHHTKMQSTVLINYGKPIPISKYKNLNQISEAKAINEIRTDVEAGLKPLIINISNDEYYDTIEEIRLIFPELVHHKAGEFVSTLYAELKSGQQLISAIEPWISSNENEAKNLKLIVNSIKSGTTALKLKYHLLINEDHKVFVNIVFLILGLPLHVVGVILNYLPYKVPEWFVNKKIKDPHFHSSIKMIGGSVTIFTYGLISSIIFGFVLGWNYGIIYFFCSPLLGLFSLKYWVLYLKTRGRIRYNLLRKKKDKKLTELLKLKEQLFTILKDLY